MKRAYLLILLFVLIFAFAGQGSFGRAAAQVGESMKGVPEKNGADAVKDDATFRVISPKNKYDSFMVPYFKRYLKNSELTDLSAKVLLKDDLEVRVWRNAFRSGVSAFVLKRVSSEWSASSLDWSKSKSMDDYPLPSYGKPAYRKLSAKASGWDSAWSKITVAGILTLPSAWDIGCQSLDNDGTIYFVEYNFSNTYRTYVYENPRPDKCVEAKQMLELIKLIRLEYYTADVDVYKY